MAVEKDDEGLRKEEVAKVSESIILFRTILEDLLEDPDERIRDDASYVLGRLQHGDIGLICDRSLNVRSNTGREVVITRVELKDRFLPVFVVSSELNGPDVFDQLPNIPILSDVEPSRELMRPEVEWAVTTMAFALRSADRLAGESKNNG